MGVNCPKGRNTFCAKCNKHVKMKVTQYKKSAESKQAQGRRRYDRKQQGFGGQSKPILSKKAKTTKKLVLRMECTTCKWKNQVPIKRTKRFELGGEEEEGPHDPVLSLPAFIRLCNVWTFKWMSFIPSPPDGSLLS